MRCNYLDRKYAEMVRKSPNKTTREKLATRYACYFSVLLELEYFDAIRFIVIDPMHNLYLGTAKRMFQLWLDRDLLTKAKLKVIATSTNLGSIQWSEIASITLPMPAPISLCTWM